VKTYLDDKGVTARLVAQFREIHLGLRRDAARQAAAALIDMLNVPEQVQ
jgi:hypothetical protein